MRVGSATSFDIRFQFRHGISIIYTFFLIYIPDSAREYLAILFIFIDPSVLGFFFIGGILLLEREQNILNNLFITPFRVHEYLIAKVISLALLASGSCTVIILLVFGWSVDWIALLIGVGLGSAIFTLLGVTLAVRTKALNHYILFSHLYFVFYLPLFGYLVIWDTPLYNLLPSQASLILIKAALTQVEPAWGFILANLLTWLGIAYAWAYQAFQKYIILRIGS